MELNPKTVVWEYTLKCNSKCIHCGSDAKNPRKDELTTEESLNLVEQIKKIGFDLIVLSGGEPTLRKDWVKISEKIKSENIDLGILTNTLAWGKNTADIMSSLDPYAIGFSVDGEEKLHDYLRGVSGSHKKVFDSIRELRRRDTTTCVVTSVNKLNLKQLPLIRNRIIVYGVDAWQIQVTSPMGRMTNNMDLILNNKEYYELGEFIVETRERLPHINVQAGDCIGYFGLLEEKIRDGEWYGCMAGIESIGIDSNGDIRGCLAIRTDKSIEGNIRKLSLENIWQNLEKFKYNRNSSINNLEGDCKACDKGLECKGGCQSQSIAFFDEFHHAPYCFLKNE